MTGRFLLDTNIIIALFAHDDSVERHLVQAREVFIPSVALGELYYGAQKSKYIEANTKTIHHFTESNSILLCDGNTAEQYGKIKNGLRKKGRPIPENDLWIASIAKQHTRDKHFNNIDGITIQEW